MTSFGRLFGRCFRFRHFMCTAARDDWLPAPPRSAIQRGCYAFLMPQHEDRPFSRYSSDDNMTWKIAIGVFIGILAAGLVGYWVRMYFIQQALNDFNKSIQQISIQSQRAVQESQRQQAARQQQAIDLANQKKLDLANAQRQAEAIQQQRVNETARKEAAWAKYYRKPSHCDAADGQAFVECANGHIRAKRQFEELYAAGKLP